MSTYAVPSAFTRTMVPLHERVEEPRPTTAPCTESTLPYSMGLSVEPWESPGGSSTGPEQAAVDRQTKGNRAKTVLELTAASDPKGGAGGGRTGDLRVNDAARKGANTPVRRRLAQRSTLGMRREAREPRGSAGRRFSATCVALVAAVLVLCSSPRAAGANLALHIRVDGVINPIEVRYVRHALAVARDERAAFVLMSLDTPGGLVASMQQIVAAMANSTVPVVAFVEPRTAQASSAGAFLLLASDVAVMAPGTRVGAAHPIEEGKSLDHVLDEKVTNSLVSLAEGLAAEHHRPPKYAESIVRESKSFTSDEAKQAGAIELLANDVPDLLAKLDGYRTSAGGRELVLVTKGLALKEMPMSASSRLFDVIADPTLASVLLTLGVLGILYELSSPGIGAAGIVGTICLVLALVALSTLPLALGGVVLCLAGVIAVAVEVKAPSHGALAAGGVAALVLGASILVDEHGYFGAAQRLDLRVFAPLVLVLAASFLLFGRLVARAMKVPMQSGVEAMKGARGSVKTRVSPAGGMVFVAGSRWNAVSEEVVEEGQPVIVTEVMENPTRLRVKPAEKGAE